MLCVGSFILYYLDIFSFVTLTCLYIQRSGQPVRCHNEMVFGWYIEMNDVRCDDWLRVSTLRH